MTILAELHQDHVNLNKLLFILRQNGGQLRAGKHPNFNLISDVIAYIGNYADGFHHPREDRLYEYFSGRAVQLDEQLNKCLVDHEKIKVATTQLKEAVDGVLQGAIMPMAQFADCLDEFVDLQLNHLNTEESELFPLIEQYAKPNDWVVLAQALPRPNDPLFGEQQAQEYTALYRELIMELNCA